MKNVTSAWDIATGNIQDVDKHLKNANFQLENINFVGQQGMLIAVVGPVGSGKSSLLMTLLSEMPVKSGEIRVNGNIAYCPQEAWVFSGTIQQNILFGEAMEEERYRKVLSDCALDKDLHTFEEGDNTLLGEKGYSLSGGQRARVNLARALYRKRDVYLLDDPLSAVDSHVAKHIFEKCIKRAKAGKTIILVTHQIQFLRDVDFIYVMEHGHIKVSGKYKEILSEIDLTSFIEEEKAPAKLLTVQRSVSCISATSTIGDPEIVAEVGAEYQGNSGEELVIGSVGIGVFKDYFAAGNGSVLGPLFLFLLLGSQASINISDWWITGGGDPSTDIFEWIYFAVLFGGVLLMVFKCIVFFNMTGQSSRHLHDTIFNKVLRAPITFFDENPVGRIVNRFSRDMGLMDDMIPFTFNIIFMYVGLFVGVVVMVSITNPWTLLLAVPVSILVVFLRQYSGVTIRAVKRIEAASRSPVYSHLTATLRGLHIIRAFKMEDGFIWENNMHQDKNTAAWFIFISAQRWFGLRMDLVVAIYFTGCIVASFLIPEDAVDGGLLGLSLSYIVALLSIFQYLMRQTLELENYMTSVERIVEYTDLEQEAEQHTSVTPPPQWPDKGNIVFENMSLAYSPEAPPVLKNINISIKAKEKIGIVGRTGAGKSSLLSCLFRMVEPTGSIHIDDINIMELGLKDLREKISIIPQDPVLFNGTLRYNLDPLEEFDDVHIWQSLSEVKLREKAEALPGGLYAEMGEDGTNFSVGQRQLVCLARAILRKNNILVIDEATANVDQETDKQIQRTIRSKFRECTVLCIAHRLNTIMDSDRVLVLDQGEVAQFDHPYNLLQDKNNVFSQLVEKTGSRSARKLFEIAYNTYCSKSVVTDFQSGSHATENGNLKDDIQITTEQSIKLNVHLQQKHNQHAYDNDAYREDGSESTYL